MALFSRTPGAVCTRPTRGPHGAAAGVAVAAPEGGSPDGSGASVDIRIIGALEGGKHPRVVMFCTKRYITVDAGTLVPAFESGCDAVSFFFLSSYYCFFFSFFLVPPHVGMRSPQFLLQLVNVDISISRTLLHTFVLVRTLISLLFLV